MDKPQYTKKPIGNIESLAKALSINVNQLIRLAQQADSFFYLHERKEKPDGTYRDIFGVKEDLKVIQKRIVQRVYNHILFPEYLPGSIKADAKPRGHISDACLHTGAALLIRMDISNFFPSVGHEVVCDVWKRFFNFPSDVASLFTQLTTYQGFLPQGAPTSPGLGNLVFWDREGKVVRELRELGFFYTRYVDDISISTNANVDFYKLAPLFSKVFGMFLSKGLKPNRNKIDIFTAGQQMIVHNLNVNSKVPTIPRKEQSRIRAAVKECEVKAASSRLTTDYEDFGEAYTEEYYI